MIMGQVDLVIPINMSGIIGRSTSFCNPQRSGVRRSLFGPVDHEQNLWFVREELSRIQQEDEQRWNFKFKTETPTDGRYEWTPVENVEEVHPSYGLQRLGLLRCRKHEERGDNLTNDQDAKFSFNPDAKSRTSSKSFTSESGNRKLRQTKMSDYLKKRKHLTKGSTSYITKGTSRATKTHRKTISKSVKDQVSQ
ncbi:cyclin-dependent kinase inhibitor 1C-like isoform X1 [Tachypleus tridentatus]|uniref:cyclin-dependent kinase inhibitor 1C-like isoform X1 n=1 Tax=Tachypleus tridentatus TaxID=6853 RepID=UPI003FD3D0C6